MRAVNIQVVRDWVLRVSSYLLILYFFDLEKRPKQLNEREIIFSMRLEWCFPPPLLSIPSVVPDESTPPNTNERERYRKLARASFMLSAVFYQQSYGDVGE